MSYRPSTHLDRFVVSLVATGLVFFAVWAISTGSFQ